MFASCRKYVHTCLQDLTCRSHTNAHHNCRETAAKRKPKERLPAVQPLLLTVDPDGSVVYDTVTGAPQKPETIKTADKKTSAKTSAAKKAATKKAGASKTAVRKTVRPATGGTDSRVGNDGGDSGNGFEGDRGAVAQTSAAELAAEPSNCIAPSGAGLNAARANGEVIPRAEPKDTAVSDMDAPPKNRAAKKTDVKDKPAKKTAAKKTAAKKTAGKNPSNRYKNAKIYTDAPEVMADEDVEVLMEEKLPEPIFSRLFPFQREGVRFGVKHQGRVLLGDEMGLGKTMQASLPAPPHKHQKAVLANLPLSSVLCPG